MEKKNQYVAPEVLVVECEVEKGFASTTLGFGEEVEEAGTRSTNWWFDKE